MTDPISDMLTRIRNAYLVKKPDVVLPYSNFKYSLAKMLEQQGWLAGASESEVEGRKALKLVLKYDETGDPVISGIDRVSKPGQRIYAKNMKLGQISRGLGTVIVSTSKGLMTDRQAKREKVGGEVLCHIW